MLIIKEDFKRLEREQNSAGFGNGKVQTDIIGLRKYPLKLQSRHCISSFGAYSSPETHGNDLPVHLS